jgi:hypothetical protein
MLSRKPGSFNALRTNVTLVGAGDCHMLTVPSFNFRNLKCMRSNGHLSIRRAHQRWHFQSVWFGLLQAGKFCLIPSQRIKWLMNLSRGC